MSATILWYQHAEGGARHGFAWPFPAVIAEQVAAGQMVPCQPPDKAPLDGEVSAGPESGVVGVRVRRFVRRVPDKQGVEQEVVSFELLDEIPLEPVPQSPQERRARLMAELAELDAADEVVVPETSPDVVQRADLPASGEGPKPSARAGAGRGRREE